MNKPLKNLKIAIFSAILFGFTSPSFAQESSSLANKAGERIGRNIKIASEAALQNRMNAISGNNTSYNLINVKIPNVSDGEIIKYIYAGSIIIPVLINGDISIVYYNPFIDVAVISDDDQKCVNKCNVYAFFGEDIRNEQASYLPGWLNDAKFIDKIIQNTRGIIDKYDEFIFDKDIRNEYLQKRILRMAINVYSGDGGCRIKDLDLSKIYSLSGFDKVKYENRKEKNYLIPTSFFLPPNGIGIATFSSFSVPGVFVIASVNNDCSIGSVFGFDLNRSMN